MDLTGPQSRGQQAVFLSGSREENLSPGPLQFPETTPFPGLRPLVHQAGSARLCRVPVPLPHTAAPLVLSSTLYDLTDLTRIVQDHLS